MSYNPQPRTGWCVYHWDNGIVTVIDQNGSQLPEYQGRYGEVKLSILNDAPETTQFFYAKWGEYRTEILRDEF